MWLVTLRDLGVFSNRFFIIIIILNNLFICMYNVRINYKGIYNSYHEPCKNK